MITKKKHVIEYFNSGIKKKKDIRIGIEHEKFLFNQKNDRRIDYSFEFDASGSEGAFVTYEWDFGDGNTAVGEKVQHNWSQGGLFFVVLTAKDAEGRQSVAFQEISVDHREGGDGDVSGGNEDTVVSSINPYVENVNIYINLTGESALPLQEDVTVTIISPSGVVFEENYLLGAQPQYVEYKTDSGEMVGDWEINLESNDPTSDFSYTYNWVTYFQDNS